MLKLSGLASPNMHTHICAHYKGFSYTHPHGLYPGGFNLTAMGLILQFPSTSHRG